MTNTEHTPGPWFMKAEPYDSYYQISDDFGTSLAQVEAWDGDNDEELMGQAKANARLIIAAPKLLEACRMVVARWERGDLAEAARACQSAVESATASGPPWDITDGRTVGCKPWSVLLLYPDYANDSGAETYYAFVEATDPIEAVTQAQRQAVALQEGIDIEPDDFAPLLVTQGHQYSEPLFNK